MGERINGWQSSQRFDLVLSTGDNNNVIAGEHMILIPVDTGTRVTGFIPPDYDDTWMMTVSNGGASDLVFPHNDSGSDEGRRVLMPPPFTEYTLAPAQTVFLAFTFNADDATIQGWYPLVFGVIS